MLRVGQIIKVRTVKNYPQASNHVIVGNLLTISSNFLTIRCRTFHFSNVVNAVKTDIREGNLETRYIPIARIELVNDLPNGFAFDTAELQMVTESGNVFLVDDKKNKVLISKNRCDRSK